jgi:hypothetical protein
VASGRGCVCQLRKPSEGENIPIQLLQKMMKKNTKKTAALPTARLVGSFSNVAVRAASQMTEMRQPVAPIRRKARLPKRSRKNAVNVFPPMVIVVCAGDER